jgi:hypothetical protein
MMPERFVSRFTGVCNRCGLCCQYEAPDGSGLVRCGYLAVRERPAEFGGVGTAEATECLLHTVRYNGMPIPMFFVTARKFYGVRMCAKDAPEEDAAIQTRGIGKGCSLTVSR